MSSKITAPIEAFKNTLELLKSLLKMTNKFNVSFQFKFILLKPLRSPFQVKVRILCLVRYPVILQVISKVIYAIGVFYWSRLVSNWIFAGREQRLQSQLGSVVVFRLVMVGQQNIKHI